MPGESDMFAANETRCAVPLDGAGGCMQVLEVRILILFDKLFTKF